MSTRAAAPIDWDLIPPPVVQICRLLGEAGHPTYVVGGAVRDLLLGRAVCDWDVATAAPPQIVQSVFSRTVPTGIKHGTVTVLMGDLPVEVTTFRAEGAYSDGRHPDTVEFGVCLHEDLRRRDFTINAIAVDPVKRQIEDPLDGRADLMRRVVRAVGDPLERFTEDGLRPIRAIRFATVLAFEIEPKTLDAILVSLDRFRSVAAERIRVEFFKLLGAHNPSSGLSLMHQSRLLPEVLPPFGDVRAPRVAELGRVLDALPDGDAPLRLAALVRAELSPARQGRRSFCVGLAKRLKLSGQDRSYLIAASLADERPLAEDSSAPELRRFLRRATPDLVSAVFALWRAERGLEVSALGETWRAVQEVRSQPQLLSVRDLVLDGNDLVKALARPPGRWLGEMLESLLQRVIDDPDLNRRDALIELARELDG